MTASVRERLEAVAVAHGILPACIWDMTLTEFCLAVQVSRETTDALGRQRRADALMPDPWNDDRL